MNYKLIKLNKVLLSIISILTILLILALSFANALDAWIINKFIAIYIVSFLLCTFYVIIVAILQLKNLNKKESRKKIIGFSKFFLFNFLILFILSIIFNKFDIWRILIISFSGSFGFNFLDLAFLKDSSKFNSY